MICQKCQNTGFYNEVMGKGYYYCRTCKDEIQLEATEEESSKPPTGYWGGSMSDIIKNWHPPLSLPPNPNSGPPSQYTPISTRPSMCVHNSWDKTSNSCYDCGITGAELYIRGLTKGIP